MLISSTTDLASLRNRLEFGQTTNSTGVIDRRLVNDARAHGMDSLTLEVLDVLDAEADRSEPQTAADLRALEDLWREKTADQPHY